MFHGEVIGRDQLELWSRGLDRSPRRAGTTRRSSSTSLRRLRRRPIGTVAAIYRHFGLALSGAARAAMRALHEQSAPAARAGHRYSLADFGLTDRDVDERFGPR